MRVGVLRRRLSMPALISMIMSWALFSAWPVAAQVKLEDAQLVQALKAGGHVIVFRHGATFSNQADTDPLNPANVARQRQLNDKGIAAAKSLGAAFKAIGVPVGPVWTSEFYRAYQTAVLAGLPKPVKTREITEGGLVVSPDENTRRAAAFRKLASMPPPNGVNTIIVSHKPNIIDSFGRDWFDVKEGEASIFKPEGAAYKLVARVQMDDWPRIAAAPVEK